MTDQTPRTARWNLDMERPTDWMESRGSLLYLTVGPFGFAVRTSDGWYLGFGITFAGRTVSWALESQR